MWAHAYLSTVERYARGGRLIDVGPANNPFPNPAATNGFDVTVMDFKRPPALLPSVTFIAGSLNAGSSGTDNLAGAFDW